MQLCIVTMMKFQYWFIATNCEYSDFHRFSCLSINPFWLLQNTGGIEWCLYFAFNYKYKSTRNDAHLSERQRQRQKEKEKQKQRFQRRVPRASWMPIFATFSSVPMKMQFNKRSIQCAKKQNKYKIPNQNIDHKTPKWDRTNYKQYQMMLSNFWFKRMPI